MVNPLQYLSLNTSARGIQNIAAMQ